MKTQKLNKGKNDNKCYQIMIIDGYKKKKTTQMFYGNLDDAKENLTKMEKCLGIHTKKTGGEIYGKGQEIKKYH